MPWYKITKTINGHRYDYWQRTYRNGNSVKTENRYIGPAGTAPHVALAAITSPTAPYVPGEALAQIKPTWSNLDGKDGLAYEKQAACERAEDERIQYGNLKVRIAKHAKLYRTAKRKTRGIKSVNPFLAMAMRKK